MSKNEAAQDAFKHLNQNINMMVEPWMRAVQAWTSGAEKMQQSAKDNFTKMLEDGHRMTKESMEMATNVSATLQKQLTAQVERATALFTSFSQH